MVCWPCLCGLYLVALFWPIFCVIELVSGIVLRGLDKHGVGLWILCVIVLVVLLLGMYLAVAGRCVITVSTIVGGHCFV